MVWGLTALLLLLQDIYLVHLVVMNLIGSIPAWGEKVIYFYISFFPVTLVYILFVTMIHQHVDSTYIPTNDYVNMWLISIAW